MQKILIKKHVEDLVLPQKIEQGDWIDLRAAEDIFIPMGEAAVISLGVSMKLPDGYEAHIAPRSSTFKNFGIIMVNSLGIVDNSCCGNDDIWKFPAFCIRGNHLHGEVTGTMIHKNDRICQFRIMKKQPEIEFEEVTFLDSVNRGGIGSTGVQ